MLLRHCLTIAVLLTAVNLAPAQTKANRPNVVLIVTDDQGGRMFVSSDTDHCETRQAQGHRGTQSAAPHKEARHG